MKKSNIYHIIGKKSGAIVVIIGAVHGNEKIGVQVIESLKKTLNLKEISGELYLIIANPRALEQNKRFIDTDLNRLFGETTPQFSAGVEEKRSEEIKPILQMKNYI